MNISESHNLIEWATFECLNNMDILQQMLADDDFLTRAVANKIIVLGTQGKTNSGVN